MGNPLDLIVALDMSNMLMGLCLANSFSLLLYSLPILVIPAQFSVTGTLQVEDGKGGKGLQSLGYPKQFSDFVVILAKQKVAINAVLRASKVCQKVFKQLVNAETIIKKDKSPVTTVVNAILFNTFPNDPIVGEEDSKDLHGNDASVKELRKRILNLTNSVLDDPLDEKKLLDAIDRGSHPGGAKGRFLRGEQFAVCLALVVDGKVQLGVTGCPNLPIDFTRPESERGCIFVALRGHGAFQGNFSSTEISQMSKIHMRNIDNVSEASFCESVEAAHSSQDDSAKIASMLEITKSPVRIDSQTKYAVVSRGDADIYLRLPVNEDYQENIW
ncbi:607_t:CDS:2 [Entrophospora sp. SA101]|nr:607_t:CDS:2 [Entrophospora sp. SA101]